MKADVKGRIFIVGCVLSLGGLAVVGRLFFIQLVSHSYYQALASRQQNSSADFNVPRGNIYFREAGGGLFNAAFTKSGFLIYIDPRKIKDAENVYNLLDEIMPGKISREDFFKKAAKKDDPFEMIAGKLDSRTAEKINKLALPGVGILEDEWRFYPGRELASHILGFVGYKDDELVGRYGIEYAQEGILGAKKTFLDGQRTLAGVFLDWGRKIFPDVKPDYDVVLTVEPQVQLFLEKELQGAFDKWQAELGGGVILDSKTGRILAMAARPAFDPNKYNEVKSLDLFVNPNVEHIYEFGSVFKPLTFTAAFDAGKLSPESSYFDSGFLVIGGKRIENYDAKGRGLVDMQKVLNESLNTGAVFAMRKLGQDNLKKYFEKFGLAQKTGADLPGDVSGDMSNLKNGSEIEYATASYGQGIAVSPLAFLRAINVLASGGRLVSPFVVERVMAKGAPDVVTQPQITEGVISQKAVEDITRMLVRVVDEALAGGTAKNPKYSVAAKTGTAELPNIGGKGYSGEYLHSFFGYGPAYDSNFSIFLFLVKPQGARYASQTLTDPFSKIMNFLFNYYSIPPDR